jgi:hypothetical protein
MRVNLTPALSLYRVALPFLLAVAGVARLAAGQTNIYSTQFEAAQGYNSNLDLAGQNGWLSDGPGGNGLTTGFFPGEGQQAYIGYTNGVDKLFVYRRINFDPLAAGMPSVRFSTLMSIEDSFNGEFDYFQWQVYNISGDRLFVIDFDVFATNVNYFLDGGSGYIDTGVTFGLSVTNTLTVTMNFASNRWSATLNAALLATNQPITTTGKQLTLGDVDALWQLHTPNVPGDNFMLFDNYTISAEVLTPGLPPQPHLTVLGRAAGQTSLRLTGQNGNKFAIEASTNFIHWTALKTNLISDGSFDYIDTSSAALNRRLYRARWVP